MSGQPICNEQIKEWLLDLLEGEESVYGYKLLTECLRRDHSLSINPKKTYWLCGELGILKNQRIKKVKHPRTLPKNRTVTGSNQLWQMDIKYGYIHGEDRFFFLLSIIDVFDRVIVNYYMGTVCKAVHAVQTLFEALSNRLNEGDSLPAIRTDNGPQFVSALFGDMCESINLVHERIPPRTPDMNAYIESFHSLLERDVFAIREFDSLEEAYSTVDRYMDFYNNRKMHGSLRKMPPMKFSLWVKTQEDCSTFHKSM